MFAFLIPSSSFFSLQQICEMISVKAFFDFFSPVGGEEGVFIESVTLLVLP